MTIEVKVGNIGIGGNNPVRVQSMTNTPTDDVQATATQIMELADAGSELVRFTVMNDAHAKAVPEIKKVLVEKGYDVPLIGDFHYNGHDLLTKYPEMAKTLDKYRINPGNVGFGDKHDENFKQMIEVSLKNNKPVRIGINFGSIDQSVYMKLMDDNAKLPEDKQRSSDALIVDAMNISALQSAKKAMEYGMPENKIILATKVSNVKLMIESYRELSKKTNLPLHLGLTEAGMGTKGIVASTAALSVLLQEGIGDTIRVSITPGPNDPRTEEVFVSQQVLQANGIRQFMPSVTSCPGCGRTTSTLFQEIAEQITDYLKQQTPVWRKQGLKGFEGMVVAVMGCVVNGPGESKHANIGLSLPGAGEDPNSPIFVDGKLVKTLRGEARIEDFKKMIDDYVQEKYA